MSPQSGRLGPAPAKPITEHLGRRAAAAAAAVCLGSPWPLVSGALGSGAGPAAAWIGCPAGEPLTSTRAGNDACGSDSVFSAKWSRLLGTQERLAPPRPGLDQLRRPPAMACAAACSSRATGKGTAWQRGPALLGRPSQGQKRQLLANVPPSPCLRDRPARLAASMAPGSQHPWRPAGSSRNRGQGDGHSLLTDTPDRACPRSPGKAACCPTLPGLVVPLHGHLRQVDM